MKKNFYLSLTVILGILMFFLLHRLIFTSWTLFIGLNPKTFSVLGSPGNWVEILTLIIAVLGGAFYGAWLGDYWFDKVYLSNLGLNTADLIAHKFISPARSHSGREAKLSSAAHTLQHQLINTSEQEIKAKILPIKPAPIKRTLSRATGLKKTTTKK